MKHIFVMHDIKRNHDFEPKIHEIMNTLDYEVIYKTSIQDTVKYMKEYPVPARFYAVGGDGTIHGMIQALVNTQHELVVIPNGTGNDFCRTLTKEKNPAHILKKSLSLKAQKVDTVLINDTYYMNSACFGVDSVIANHVHDTPDIVFVSESKSYIVSVLQHVFRYQNDEVTFMSEGKCLYKGKVTLCTLNNGRYYGGGFPITPQADIQDGYIDVCIVDKVPKAKIPYLLIFLIRGKLHKRREAHYFRVKEATVYCENSCNLDGEEYKKDHYDFQIAPQSLNLVLEK